MNTESLQKELHTKWIGRQSLAFQEIDSTNDEAFRRAGDGAEEGLLVMADFQTRGKGRKGRRWDSVSGGNIAMSILLRPDISPSAAPRLTLVMALSAAQGIKEASGILTGIKWPNDIVVKGKKICGILTEMKVCGADPPEIVIGVGINVNTEGFPEEIRDRATSLFLESGKKQSCERVMASILEWFEKYYEVFLKTGTLAELKDNYDQACVNNGRRVCVMDPKGQYEAEAVGINEKGELLIIRDDGSMDSVYAGEVSVRGIYGYA